MSEDWRRKGYYDPRVLIDVPRVLDPQFYDSVLCLTGAQLEMLRNLTAYLARRSTFVSEYHDGYYLAPDNDEWDAIQAIVADLEEAIMGCEEFTNLLQSVLECVCQSASLQQHDAYLGPGTQEAIDKYMTDGGLQVEDTYGGTVPADGERCAIAQLTYATAYEFLTEYTSPLSSALVAIVLPLAMGALATMLGATVIGIPVATLILVLTGLIELWTLGALENVANEYTAYKEELVCALYNGLATSYRQAETEAVAVIAEMNIGPTDKVLLHTMVAPWAMHLAKIAYDNATAWALANVEDGYCDECEFIVGSDWFAVPVDLPLHIEWSTGTWDWDCVQGALIPGKTTVAFVLEVVERSGMAVLVWMQEDQSGCTGAALAQNSSRELLDGLTYYCYVVFTHDEDEAIATLCPGAGKYNEHSSRTGPGDWELSVRGGAAPAGYADLMLRYIVYDGLP
jgi:hypothetical protein